MVDLERRRECRHDPLDDAVRAALVVPLGDQQHELVAPGARDSVPVAHARDETLAGDAQQPVADVVAEAVVDQLEVVEIDEGDAERALVTVRERELLVEPVLEQVAVGEPRQRVVVRLVLELVLVALELGDVVLDADEMRDLVGARIAYRGHVQHVPEQTAVLAVVAQQRLPVALLGDRAADLVELGLVAIDALKQPAVASQHLVAAVARDPLERRD